MKQFITFVFLIVVINHTLHAQKPPRPKLVVGIVVDQMRWDYLYRYSNHYGNDGFQRLLQEGFSCENTLIPYTPTYTAAGHSCIYTGSVPSLHGIMGNSWYSRDLKKTIYCTDDNEVYSIGSNSAAGKMSPKNLWSNTITDELRLATNFKNKTVAISLKDRASILPGGHSANEAFWFDDATGGWISSSFYMKTLPQWMVDLNAKNLPDVYLKQNWNTLNPITTYTESSVDNESFESKVPGEDNTFPHTTDSVKVNKYETFKSTPYGNTFTFETAKAAILAESLGKGAFTDFLALSFSSTDYIGHMAGPNSIEVEDTYLRFDKDLASFLKYLDATVGKGQYLLFLTADHGVAHIPAFLKEDNLPGGVISDAAIKQQLNDAIQKEFKITSAIAQVINYQIYFDDAVLSQNNINKQAAKQVVINALLAMPAIAKAIDLENLQTTSLPQTIKTMLTNGYNQKLSGDVQYIFKPEWFAGSATGTTHGLWYPYDAHIPLLWFGWNIKSGKTNREVYMTDIAATLAALLHIQMPNACIGKVIEEVAR